MKSLFKSIITILCFCIYMILIVGLGALSVILIWPLPILFVAIIAGFVFVVFNEKEG